MHSPHWGEVYAAAMSANYREHILPNGLKIVAELDSNAVSAAIGFFVRSGARDEPAELMGISHFLEHMVFKGTESRESEDIDAGFDDLGAHHNAWTSHEITAFHVHSLPDALLPAFDILADIMQPALRESDLDDERGVVLEEIAMYDDQPFWQLWERAAEVYYDGHPMGHRVLGTRETVSAITADSMRSWHEDRYGAENIVLAAAGRVDFDVLSDAVARQCGHWSSGSADRAPFEHGDCEEAFTMTRADLSAAYLIGLAPAPPMQDPRRHAAAVLAWVMGRGDGSRLHWALVDQGIAEEAHTSYEAHDQSGQFVSWAVCPPARLAEVEATIRTVHDELVDSITEDDLAMARAMLRTAATVHGELPAGRMQRLGRLQTTLGIYRSLEEDLEAIDAITLDDLRDVADAWPTTPRVTAQMVPSD